LNSGISIYFLLVLSASVSWILGYLSGFWHSGRWLLYIALWVCYHFIGVSCLSW
jgi:hypothetical protein